MIFDSAMTVFGRRYGHGQTRAEEFNTVAVAAKQSDAWATSEDPTQN